MKKFELIKKLIADISNNEKYKGNIYVERSSYDEYDSFFVVENDNIYTSGKEDYYVYDFIEEEVEYVKQINEELCLYMYEFGREWLTIEELVEYYYDQEDEEAVLQIEKLLDVLNDEKSLFYRRKDNFVHILNRLDLKSGVKYVYREPNEELLRWKDDITPYWSLEPLYDTIKDECCEDIMETLADLDEDDEELDHWINILSEIDKYIL